MKEDHLVEIRGGIVAKVCRVGRVLHERQSIRTGRVSHKTKHKRCQNKLNCFFNYL
jgi:hypothetical protein